MFKAFPVSYFWRWFLPALVILVLPCLGPWAQDAEDDNGSAVAELRYLVRPLVFSYGNDGENRPDLSNLGLASLQLSSSSGPVTLNRLMAPEGEPILLTSEDIHHLGEVVLHYLKAEGFDGVVVFPSPKQIDSLTGKDLRGAGETRLDIIIWLSRVDAVKLEYQGHGKESIVREERIRGLLEANQAENGIIGTPLRSSFGRFVERFGNHPGRTSRMLLMPGEEPGSITALVRMNEKRLAQGGLSVSNSGTKTTGKWIFGGFFRRNQVTNLDDHLNLSWGLSDSGERKAVALGYRRPLIGPDILELGVNFAHSNYDATSFAVTRIDFEGRSNSASAELRWRPLEFESDTRKLEFFVGVGVEESRASNSLVVGEGKGEFLTPRAGAVLHEEGPRHKSLTSLAISGNMARISTLDQVILGGIDVEDQFSRLNFSYLNRFDVGDWLTDLGDSSLTLSHPENHHLHFRATADLGLRNARHLPQKQFILGGTGSIRGYPEAPVAGDKGFLVSLEYQLDLDDRFPIGKNENISATLAPFIDFGKTYVNDPLSYESDHQLVGAGIGLQLKLPYGGSARFDFAKPLKEVVNAGTVLDGTRSGDGRVHAMISWEF